MKTVLRFRFDYGRIVPWVRKDDGELRAVAGPDGVLLRTPVQRMARTKAPLRSSPSARATVFHSS